MAEFLEIVMIVSFGISWPINLSKLIRSKSTKGVSLPFLCLIFFGYIAGIVSKFVNTDYMANFAAKWYVLVFYVINLIVVGLNLIFYFINRKKEQEGQH